MYTIPRFEVCFHALTGHSPMRWQARLFGRMLSGATPSACDLPTGLGKTAIIPIWLIALASQGRNSEVHLLPRRLVYIVNRRTVVDQATEIIERMRERLQNPADNRWTSHEDALCALRHGLQLLWTSGDEHELLGVSTLRGELADNEHELLGVSTLRGELADNEEWKSNPARPAIVVGTIDMIGSKLLFSGYGDGRYYRAHHAGLIGQDVLIVHDEAHLTPAFSDLLRRVEDVQRQAHEPRPLQVVELSATQRNGDDDNVLRLEAEDENDTIVIDRLNAMKYLRLHETDEKEGVAKIVELGRQHDKNPSKVLIYLRSPEKAQRVAELFKKALGCGGDNRVALLTGTIRGHDRDRLASENRVYRALLDRKSQIERTIYLVSTSAGEVGIDLDADHMVCDLTTLDAMIQRLGRVNRRGGKGRMASVDVVSWHEKPQGPLSESLQETHATIKCWINGSNGVDVCPRNLRKLLAGLSRDKRLAAFSPKRDRAPLTDILLDTWSLTSIDKMPGRLGVAAYLHGLTYDPSETYIAWRKEVRILGEVGVDAAVLRDWFRACRIETRERLRDRTDRVRKTLACLLKAHRLSKKTPKCDFAVVLLDERGKAEMSKLSKITEKNFHLDYLTVVLPVEAGGLSRHGMLDAKTLAPACEIDVAEASPRDVAEASPRDEHRERWLYLRGAEGEYYKRLLTDERRDSLPPKLREQEQVVLKQQLEDIEEERLVLLTSPCKSVLDSPETTRARQTLAEHTHLIAEQMARIARGLRLKDSIRDALVVAARWHDRGKERPVWQRYACGQGGTEPLAKSIKYLPPCVLGGYRHEFGSLLDAGACTELCDHPEGELVLHLISAHHGWARPHFELRSFDHNRTSAENTEAAIEVIRRFGRLQQRFGRWGLAWLESLLRCADIAASKAAAAKAAPVPEEEEVSA